MKTVSMDDGTVTSNLKLTEIDASKPSYYDGVVRVTFYDSNNNVVCSNNLNSDEFIYISKSIYINLNLHVSRIPDIALPPNSKYKVIVSFERDIYSNIFVKEISPSKTEVRIGLNNNIADSFWIKWAYSPEILLNNAQRVIRIHDEKFRIINVIPDYSKYKIEVEQVKNNIENLKIELNNMYVDQIDLNQVSSKQKELSDLETSLIDNSLLNKVTFILKLSSTINSEIELPSANCFLSNEITLDQTINDVYVYSEEISESKVVKLSADPRVGSNFYDTTKWYNYNTLVSSGSASFLAELTQSLFSGISDLCIDFSNFSNHTFFGSAIEKVNNASLKIKNIQIYKDLMSNQTSSGASTTSQSYSNAIHSLENEMTQYERYVYTKSASYAWPKTSDSGSDYNYSYSSSMVQSWYSEQYNSASYYDRNNKNYLVNFLPENVIIEDDSKYMTKIIHIWGEFFDYIKNYIDQIQYLYNFDYDWINAVPPELLPLYASNFQWELLEGFDSEELMPYLKGLQQASGSTPLKDITREKWLRLLSSVPYLNKIRGTRRSVDALMNIYGIPNSIISIKEYGGSKSTGSDYIEDNTNIYCLDFYGGETIYPPSNVYGYMSGSDFTYEVRYNTTSSANLALFGNQGFNVTLETSSNSSYGSASLFINNVSVMSITGSGNISFFDGDWHNIIVQKSGTTLYLKHKKYKENQLFYNNVVSYTLLDADNQYIDSGSSAGGYLYFGGIDTNGSYSGSLQEIRLWNKYLAENEIDHHSYDFNSLAVNNPNDVSDYLVAHYKLSENKDLNASQYVNDFSWPPKYDASASLFTGNQYKNITLSARTYFEMFTLEGHSDNKINIGYVSESVEENLNRVDLVFSPVQAMNSDILTEFALFDFNNPIGNPMDMYEANYSTLDIWKNYYFKKYEGNYNFYAYLKFIESFDKSVFRIVSQVIPERANLVSGLTIGSHMLERNKYKWQKSRIFDCTYSCSVDNISEDVFDWNVDKDSNKEFQIYPNSSIQYSSSTERYIEAGRLFNTGSFSSIFSYIECLFPASDFSSILTDFIAASYEPISSTASGSSYDPIYKQLKYATSVGTQNTAATDYAGAPWEVSESSATIIRVV